MLAKNSRACLRRCSRAWPRAILALEDDPFPHGCKKLKNRDGWRIRAGDYRILYFADTKARQITICVIGHRRDVYRD